MVSWQGETQARVPTTFSLVSELLLTLEWVLVEFLKKRNSTEKLSFHGMCKKNYHRIPNTQFLTIYFLDKVFK